MFKKIIDCFFILFMPASVCRRRYQRITNERIAYIENTYHMEIAYLTGLICKGGNIGESFKEVLPKITGLNTPGLFVATFRPCNSQTMSGHVFTEIEGESQFDSIGGPEDSKSVGTGTVNIRGRGRIKALDYCARIHDSNGKTGEINLIVEDKELTR